MKDLVSIKQKMLSVSLDRYGSLYFSSDNIPGAVAAAAIGDIPETIKDTMKQRFSIGPIAARGFWNKERAKMNLNRGPWKQPQDYIISLARRELAWIKDYAIPKPKDDPLVSSQSQNSPNSHISLLERFLKVAPFLLPDDPAVVAPHVWHTDLHAGNIFVDRGKISSLIDWQGICIEPLMLPPANFKDLDSTEKERTSEHVSSSIILYLYEKQIMKEAPLFNKVLRLEHGRTRLDPIRFVGDTWDDDILPFRESLIRVERNWSKMGFDFPCPIHFDAEELRTHAEEGVEWNEVQDFWDALEAVVSRYGWTPNDGYEKALSLFAELRESGLENMVGKEREEFRRQTDWVERS